MLLLYIICFITIAAAADDGSCPPTLSVNVCDATCGPKKPCLDNQLCCPTGCGGSICVDPMTQRHFVDYIKKGTCPEHPTGAWMCSHTCTTDSDCRRILKCCTNRCGVLTCQRPKFKTNNTNDRETETQEE